MRCSHLILLVASVNSLVCADPVQAPTPATTTATTSKLHTSKPCKEFLSTTVKFGLPAGSTPKPVPDGYHDYNWRDWEFAYPHFVNPQSGLWVAASTSVTPFISMLNTEGPYVFGLQSFYFACTGEYSPQFYGPVPCNILLVSSADFGSFGFGTTSYGPFGWDAPPSYSVDYYDWANMTFVDLKDASVGGAYVYFILTQGKSGTQIIIDNVVLTQYNYACPGY